MKPGIVLEQLKLDHCQSLYELTESNRNHLREWLPWLDQIKSSNDTKKFIEATIKERSSGGAPNFAIQYNDRVCGVVGFHKIDKQHRIGAIGYWLDQDCTGKGIVTAAVREVIKMGFSEFNLNKIEIRCAENNLASRAIAERLGFKYEATLRECEWLYSKYVNHAIYSLLTAEYNL